MGKQFVVDSNPQVDHSQYQGRIELFNEDGSAFAGRVAAHVDPATGTVADVVNALIAAGLMASA